MTLPLLAGRVAWIHAQPDFDVDQIIGVKNIKISDLDALAALAMQPFDPNFAAHVRPGDLLVGGPNFGYGHPHYPPMMAMRHLGIAGVIAESFAPGFFRGEISMGFPLLTCPGIVNAVSRWDVVSVDWERHLLVNQSTGQQLPVVALAEADRAMLAHGGLIAFLKSQDDFNPIYKETSL